MTHDTVAGLLQGRATSAVDLLCVLTVCEFRGVGTTRGTLEEI